ncbi:MAG TPA: threonine synthase, partial [Syntrophomonas sp.]|nr:threonine synthase [Syntrophomonas sp.]
YNHAAFDHTAIAPLHQLNKNIFIQELWHGPTQAFKDMALQILPHLMTYSAKKTNETGEILILVATSGDTGKAALAGFQDVPGTKIVVFYPRDGVSLIQKRQMITQEGDNVYVASVEGNFDDAQSGVKQIFADQQFISELAQKGLRMSSANSINWGRLLPQIVYYISAYADLCDNGHIKAGDPINVVVPTGNFGNILAAYYASRMGIPIHKLICASNANNVLTEFIRSGRYDRNRKFYRTISPSMDILISSNLERLLYEMTNHDAEKVGQWMEQLKNEGSYQVDEAVLEKIQRLFWADHSSDRETMNSIKHVWEKYHYLLDTHTAVAWCVYHRYTELSGDMTPTIIASTASPFKFAPSVAEALLGTEALQGKSEFEIMAMLSQHTGIEIPAAIKELEQKPVLHQTSTSREEMKNTVIKLLDRQ